MKYLILKIGRFSKGSLTADFLENQTIYDLFEWLKECKKIFKEEEVKTK